jgi:hypothetical protein
MVAFRVQVWIDFQTTKSESEPPEKPVYSALVTLQNKRKKKKMRSLSLWTSLSLYDSIYLWGSDDLRNEESDRKGHAIFGRAILLGLWNEMSVL